MFATPHDVAVRLGRDLDDAQLSTAELLLEGSAAVIADAAGRPETWAAELDPVPGLVRIVAIEMVARALSNPGGARQVSERLGEYQHSTSYTDGAHGLWLTDIERRLVDKAVNGRSVGSVRVESIIEDGCGEYCS